MPVACRLRTGNGRWHTRSVYVDGLQCVLEIVPVNLGARAGFFLRDDGTTHSNVSGVLVATALQPHSFTRQNATLYENPAAARSVPGSLRWRRVVDGRRVEEPGVEPAHLFGLPAEWPGIPWP
jgi:hypothetical protein